MLSVDAMAADPKFLLDSNIAIYLIGGHARAAGQRLAECELGSVVTSSICLAEMRVGRSDAELNALGIMLQRIDVLDFDAAAAEAYARLPFKRGGFDRLIAAHAVSRGLTLVTANERDFAGIDGLLVENWTVEGADA